MSLIDNIKGIKDKMSGGAGSTVSKDVLHTTKNWFNDRNEWVQVQRNLSFFAVIVLTITVTVLVSAVTFIKNSRTIEPFVIEIEPKSGVATVVDPQTIKAYSANEAVIRHYVWEYIKARQEYFFSTFSRANDYVRVLSTPQIYSIYTSLYGPNNPQSPVQQLGSASFRSVELISMIILSNNTVAEVRFREQTRGTFAGSKDKFARVVFGFSNIDLTENDRLINPLGFNVTEYQVTDEKN